MQLDRVVSVTRDWATPTLPSGSGISHELEHTGAGRVDLDPLHIEQIHGRRSLRAGVYRALKNLDDCYRSSVNRVSLVRQWRVVSEPAGRNRGPPLQDVA